MACKTCDELLADYKNAVRVFKETVRDGLGALGHDGQVAAIRAARWSEICKQASDHLLAHWRKEHRSLAARSDS
jgi:hypothetical protein